MAKAPYGSATKVDCDKCERSISRTNFSKHKKICKGVKVRDSRKEIRKRSWVKHRAKRVDAQRSRRAAQAFRKSEELRGELHTLDQYQYPPKPEPTGLKGHPLQDLSYNAALFEYVFEKMDHLDLLSKIWFKKIYLLLHPDKRHHMPAEFRTSLMESALHETCKKLHEYKEEILESDWTEITRDRIRLEKYRVYLKTRYAKLVDGWKVECEKIDKLNAKRRVPIQEKIDGFGEGKSCSSLSEFEATYKATFIEKDRLAEAKMKAKQVERDGERRFRETFGMDSESEDE